MAARYKALIWIAVLAGGGFLLYADVAPVRLALLALAGRASVCPLANAVEADANRKDQVFLQHERAGARRVTAADPAGYHRVNSQLRQWWVPTGAESQLDTQLAWQERDIYGAAEQAPKAGDIAIDYGAHLGVWTRGALELGAKEVVAFESDPAFHECYRRNLESEIAAGKVVLLDPPLPDIDTAVTRLNLPRVDYLKVDAGGSEADALARAYRTLARFHPKISVAAASRDGEAGALAAAIRSAWPNYSMTCGPCLEAPGRRIRPETLYFW